MACDICLEYAFFFFEWAALGAFASLHGFNLMQGQSVSGRGAERKAPAGSHNGRSDVLMGHDVEITHIHNVVANSIEVHGVARLQMSSPGAMLLLPLLPSSVAFGLYGSNDAAIYVSDANTGEVLALNPVEGTSTSVVAPGSTGAAGMLVGLFLIVCNGAANTATV